MLRTFLTFVLLHSFPLQGSYCPTGSSSPTNCDAVRVLGLPSPAFKYAPNISSLLPPAPFLLTYNSRVLGVLLQLRRRERHAINALPCVTFGHRPHTIPVALSPAPSAPLHLQGKISAAGSNASSACTYYCPPGWWGAAGVMPCSACATGRWSSTVGSTSCLSCPAVRVCSRPRLAHYLGLWPPILHISPHFLNSPPTPPSPNN